MRRLALVLAVFPINAWALTLQYELETVTKEFCSRVCIEYEDPISIAHDANGGHIFDLLGTITFEIEGGDAWLIALDLEGGADGYVAGRPRVVAHLAQPIEVATGRASLLLLLDGAASEVAIDFDPSAVLEQLGSSHLALHGLLDPVGVIPARCGLLFSESPPRHLSGTCQDWAADPELAPHLVTFPERQIEGLDLQAVTETPVEAMLLGAFSALALTRRLGERSC